MRIKSTRSNRNHSGGILELLELIPNEGLRRIVGSAKKIRNILGFIIFIVIAVIFIVRLL